MIRNTCKWGEMAGLVNTVNHRAKSFCGLIHGLNSDQEE